MDLDPRHLQAFNGFHEAAFDYFEKVEAQPEWEHVSRLSPEWERHIHWPMEQLLAACSDEFGSNGYAHNLHRDPYLWAHQVGIVTVADTIAYQVVLSITGLEASGGMMRSSSDQVRRFRDAVSDKTSGDDLTSIVDHLVESGFQITGRTLRGKPRGWDAEHPRTDLAKHVTILATRQVDSTLIGSGSSCIAAIKREWRSLTPFIEWLVRNVGPRATR